MRVATCVVLVTVWISGGDSECLAASKPIIVIRQSHAILSDSKVFHALNDIADVDESRPSVWMLSKLERPGTDAGEQSFQSAWILSTTKLSKKRQRFSIGINFDLTAPIVFGSNKSHVEKLSEGLYRWHDKAVEYCILVGESLACVSQSREFVEEVHPQAARYLHGEDATSLVEATVYRSHFPQDFKDQTKASVKAFKILQDPALQQMLTDAVCDFVDGIDVAQTRVSFDPESEEYRVRVKYSAVPDSNLDQGLRTILTSGSRFAGQLPVDASLNVALSCRLGDRLKTVLGGLPLKQIADLRQQLTTIAESSKARSSFEDLTDAVEIVVETMKIIGQVDTAWSWSEGVGKEDFLMAISTPGAERVDTALRAFLKQVKVTYSNSNFVPDVVHKDGLSIHQLSERFLVGLASDSIVVGSKVQSTQVFLEAKPTASSQEDLPAVLIEGDLDRLLARFATTANASKSKLSTGQRRFRFSALVKERELVMDLKLNRELSARVDTEIANAWFGLMLEHLLPATQAKPSPPPDSAPTEKVSDTTTSENSASDDDSPTRSTAPPE